MGYDFTGGRISHSPIDFCTGLTFCGDPIRANLIRLTVFSEPETNDCSIGVWCVMIINLYDDLILTSDVVDRLTKCNISRVMTRSGRCNSAKPSVISNSDAGHDVKQC